MNRISKHITYKEATRSVTALRLGIENKPGEYELQNMELIAEKVFFGTNESPTKTSRKDTILLPFMDDDKGLSFGRYRFKNLKTLLISNFGLSKTFSNFKIVLILLFFLNTPFSTSSHINLLSCIKNILFFFKLAMSDTETMASCKWAEITFRSSSELAINFKFLFFNLNSLDDSSARI